MIDLATASPKRLRHAGDWPTPKPRRAAAGTELRALQDAHAVLHGGAAPVLSGDGTERALLIGQAPGWREIETGLPFAWDAGKRLSGWLAAAGISIDDFREPLVRDQHREVLSRACPGLVGRPSAVARRRRTLDSVPAARRSAWLHPRLVLLVGGMAHRFAFGEKAKLDDLVGRELAWEAAPGRIGPVPASPIRRVDLAQ